MTNRYGTADDEGLDARDSSETVGTVSVRNLKLSFDDVAILEDISLTVEPGEFVGFVGPNGAGKTTLLRAISGALEPDAGRVTIDGVDIHDVSSQASSRLVSVVPQDTSLSFSFPVRDVVEMGRHPHRSRFSPPTREDRDAVDRALERTRTEALADRPIDEVSGGQRQRVVLARAVAQETPALLLDEPTGSLDINHQVETLELVRELVDSGRAVCAAIHDLDLAARYCDRVVMLADGGVRRTGAPEAVLSAETLSDVFNSNAAVTENPVTGTSTVTALPAAESADFDGGRKTETHTPTDGGRKTETHTPTVPDRVHILGSGSAAVGVVARLRNADVETSLGPVPSGDIAAETARRLEIERIEAPPFDSLSESHLGELEQAISESDAVVLADVQISSGNQLVLEAVDAAEPLVVIETRSFEDRHFAGEEAKELYETCRVSALEASVERVLEAVSRATTEDVDFAGPNGRESSEPAKSTTNPTETNSPESSNPPGR
ncbi:heme ABC transporter ATP-binding protein [Halostagnicola sp. A-GB9-2]|uniref:heme ABC transporter ATP-binding protein n=1 Tax=Halostagnicola sp. A-GB9-2 TaxID=3048066 RepID=UPI0024C05AA8|nr:heme ABC transporter ATP-binding protein [Halostagnicola sp. A-GB9-2]MDJ1433327.1 heme ABC transporter ATP-binding protein [Halostagnicola sp. A-GB9-2]